jgi:hypothetical protein
MSPFTSHRSAALALLNTAPLSSKEGGFVGQMAFSDEMTAKQRRWFDSLLERHGMPTVAAADQENM